MTDQAIILAEIRELASKIMTHTATINRATAAKNKALARHQTLQNQLRDLKGETSAAALLETRFATDDSVEVVPGLLSDVADRKPFDAAVLVNVLEHVNDDVDLLTQIADAVSQKKES